MYKRFYALGGTDAPYRLTPKEGYLPIAFDTNHIDLIRWVITGPNKEDYSPLMVIKSPIGISEVSVDADMDELMEYLNSDGMKHYQDSFFATVSKEIKEEAESLKKRNALLKAELQVQKAKLEKDKLKLAA